MHTTQDRTIRVTLPACVAFVRSNRGLGLLLLVYTTVALLLIFTTIVSTLGTTDLRSAQLNTTTNQQFWAAEAALDQAIVDSSKVLPPVLAANTCTAWTSTQTLMSGMTPAAGTTASLNGQYRLCSDNGTDDPSTGFAEGAFGSASGGGGSGGSGSGGSGNMSSAKVGGMAGGPRQASPHGGQTGSGTSGSLYDLIAQSTGGASVGGSEVAAILNLNTDYRPDRAISTLEGIRLDDTEVDGPIETRYAPPMLVIGAVLKGGDDSAEPSVSLVDVTVNGDVHMVPHGLMRQDANTIITGEVLYNAGAGPFPDAAPNPPGNAIVIPKLSGTTELDAGSEYVVQAEDAQMDSNDKIIVHYNASSPYPMANLHIACSNNSDKKNAKSTEVRLSGEVVPGGSEEGSSAPVLTILFHDNSEDCTLHITVKDADMQRVYLIAPNSSVVFKGQVALAHITARDLTAKGPGPHAIELPPEGERPTFESGSGLLPSNAAQIGTWEWATVVVGSSNGSGETTTSPSGGDPGVGKK